MKDMILFPEDIDRLNEVLGLLATKANLLLAVLINKDGRLLTCQGSLGAVDTVSLAALVAGNSASTLAIASLIGENEFSTMYHQGKDKNVYIALVDENTFLALVFDDRTNIDRVKVFARQFDRQIKQSLEQVYNKSEDDVNLDLDMSGSSFAQFGSEPADQAQNPFAAQSPVSEYNVYNTPDSVGAPPPAAQPQKDTAQASQAQQGTPPPSPRNGEDEFYIEVGNGKQAQLKKPGADSHDTNYLYLHNKIKETIKRKKDE